MKLTMIADTHGMRPELPSGDVLIHCGDLTHLGSFQELKNEIDWLKSKPHRYKIFIPGNHDVCVENLMLKNLEAQLRGMLRPIFYLRDSGVTIEGVKFWGSPWIPPYSGSFQAEEDERRKRFDQIPAIDVLITHGPPAEILDGGAGCSILRDKINDLRPRVHCFGHVHEHRGKYESNGTSFFNVAKIAACHFLP